MRQWARWNPWFTGGPNSPTSRNCVSVVPGLYYSLTFVLLGRTVSPPSLPSFCAINLQLSTTNRRHKHSLRGAQGQISPTSRLCANRETSDCRRRHPPVVEYLFFAHLHNPAIDTVLSISRFFSVAKGAATAVQAFRPGQRGQLEALK